MCEVLVSEVFCVLPPLASSSSYIGVARIWLLVEVHLHDDSFDSFLALLVHLHDGLFDSCHTLLGNLHDDLFDFTKVVEHLHDISF